MGLCLRLILSSGVGSNAQHRFLRFRREACGADAPSRRQTVGNLDAIYKKEGFSMSIIRSGHSSYGQCWIEQQGTSYWVYLMDGKSQRGPYSSLADAMAVFNQYCV